MRRNQRETVVAFEPLERARLGEGRVFERGETLDGFAERALEPWCICQQRPEPEQFERRGASVVEHQQAIAQTVRDTLRVPARDRRLRACGPTRWIDEKLRSRSSIHLAASMFEVWLSEATARAIRRQLCTKVPRNQVEATQVVAVLSSSSGFEPFSL